MKGQLQEKDLRGAVKQIQFDISNVLVNVTTIQFRCTMLLAGISFDLKAREFELHGSGELLEELRGDYHSLQTSINRFNYILQKPAQGRKGNEKQTGSP